eukprot:419604_1
MATADSVGFYIAFVYMTVYASVFLCASIYCSYEVRHQSTTDRNKSTNTSYTLPIEDEIQKQMSKTKFIKLWLKSLWTKKSIYLALIPHLFDQATDFAVMWRYYELSQTNNKYINFSALFYSSVAAIIIHKIVSCSVIYSLTQSFPNVFLQLLDLMMVKAIWINYKLKTNEPGNSQRLLQLIEGTFESGPQIFISLIFMIKSNAIDGLILVSLITSLWTLSSRVNSDDKGIVEESWRDHNFNLCKSPFINWKYIIRVLGRFIEITNRIILLALIWIILGGFALGIILSFELIFILILCVWANNIMILGGLLYFWWNGHHEFKNKPLMFIAVKIYIFYRYVFSFVFLILITIFACVEFEAWKVEEFQVRHQMIISDDFGFLLLIYCWISAVLTVLFVFKMDYNVFQPIGSTREFKTLIRNRKFVDALNLLSFGIKPMNAFGSISHQTVMHYLFAYCEDYEIFAYFCDFIAKNIDNDFDTEKNFWYEKDYFGAFCIHSGSDVCKTLQYMCYLGEKCNVDMTKFVYSEWYDKNIFQKGNLMESVMFQIRSNSNAFVEYQKQLMELIKMDPNTWINYRDEQKGDTILRVISFKNMQFADLYNWMISREDIEKIIVIRNDKDSDCTNNGQPLSDRQKELHELILSKTKGPPN